MRLLAGVSSLCALLLAAAGWGVLSASCLTLAVAAVLPGRRTVLRDLPVAALTVLAGILLVAQGAAIVRFPVLGDPWLCRLVLASLALVICCVAARSSRTKTLATRSELASSIPAGLLVGIAGVTSMLPLAQGSAWYVAGGSDNLTHLVGALRRGQTGFLDYAIDAYPGAWASATALLATASANSVELSPELLSGWLRTECASVWLLFAMLSMAVGLLAQQLANRVPSLYRQAGFVGFGAAATLLGSSFWGFTVPFGFQTHILAALAVVVGVLEVSIPTPEPMRAVWVLTICGVVAAHSWTLAAAYLIAPWSCAAWRAIRALDRQALRTALVACSTAAALSVAPLILAVNTQVGVAHAGAYGAAAALPAAWIVAALLSNAVLMRRGSIGVVPFATVALGVALTVALAARVGASLSDYYPSKMLWLGAVLGVPAVWVVGALALHGVAARVSVFQSALIRPLAPLFVGLYALISMLTPPVSIANDSVRARGAAVLRAVRAPGAEQAQVVWGATESTVGDVFVRILLEFYAPAQRQTPVAVLDVPQECDLLATVSNPTVLSRHSSEEVARRYSCVSNVRTVQISSGR